MPKLKATGNKAILIDEIVALKKKAKVISDSISEKRKKLETTHKVGKKKATYITGKGGILEINSRKTFSAITTSALLKALKAKRQGKLFPSCVSVVIGQVEKVLTTDEIDKLRKQGADTYSWSFK